MKCCFFLKSWPGVYAFIFIPSPFGFLSVNKVGVFTPLFSTFEAHRAMGIYVGEEGRPHLRVKFLKLESWASLCLCTVSLSCRNASRGTGWQSQLDGTSSGQPCSSEDGVAEGKECVRVRMSCSSPRARVCSAAALADSC